MNNINYNPDVLTCLANLSNDEVFTPPNIVNDMLDILPNSLWSDKNATFLDPTCKTGVFLREIAKRLMKGLELEIPDLQERINHIFKNQLFGIAITELTGLLSRRSLYCSKHADGTYSVCDSLNTKEGNIKFEKTNHKWSPEKCIYCGASQKVYGRDTSLETHAYQFIHTSKPKELFNMKFDVIIGNPPYQISDGGAQASAKPLYHKFVQQAKKLNPRYMTMIIPARWYSGGKGLDDFRDEMINDKRIRVLHDFINASECFPSVEIKGGVCYFLWNRDNQGDCEVNTHENGIIISKMNRFLKGKSDIFIRFNDAIPILEKTNKHLEQSISNIISSRKPFGIPTNFNDYTSEDGKNIKIYGNNKIGFIAKNKIDKNIEWIDKWKIYIPKAIGSGNTKEDIIKPIIGIPNSICTETYIVLGPFESKQICENVVSYINTKFFHFLCGLKKITQDATAKVYDYIPMQDFNQSWDDEKLYKKYDFSQKEIEFIESIVREDIGKDFEVK